jgi:putative sigma-54 modulation protein
LITFYDHIISGEVYLKLENVEDEANKISEIKLQLPGNQIFAKEKCKTFEEATDLAVESLRKQIEKHKQKKSIADAAAKKAVLNSGNEEEFKYKKPYENQQKSAGLQPADFF